MRRFYMFARLEMVLKGIAGTILVLVSLSIAFSVGYLLTTQIYAWTGLNPIPLVRQVVSSFTGLFLIAIVGRILTRTFLSAGFARQMQAYSPLLNAMERISHGDFSVRVEPPRRPNVDRNPHPDDPLSKLFQGVNVMAEELNQMEAMRQEFISNVSHEIQSPLTSIRGFARALQNDQLGAQDRAHYLGIIEAESMRLSKLSDNLLALAALEADNMRFEPHPYRLDKQIRQVVLMSEPQWTSKQIDMDVLADEATVQADEDLLNQVWVNLIHNAIKFTPDGGRIRIALHQRGPVVEFAITDSGIGITEADQARIFERFYKADKSRNRALGGSGLGLSIARKIIDMHHGEIAVESTPGLGSTFKVRLPTL